MKKAHIRTQLGLKVMALIPGLTVKGTEDILKQFFKGAKTNDQMLARIKEYGGWDYAAVAIVGKKEVPLSKIRL